MNFFKSNPKNNAGSGQEPKIEKSQEQFINSELVEKRFPQCIEMCLYDTKSELDLEEKVCLARCYDLLYAHYNTHYDSIIALDKAGTKF